MSPYAFFRLLLLTVLFLSGVAAAQAQGLSSSSSATLHVIKTDINAEAENAELCLEFDAALAATPQARLASAVRLDDGGKVIIVPQNIEATGTSLCLFPLDHGKTYHLSLTGLRGLNDEKLTTPYTLSFAIPDRTPALSFTGKNGDLNGFSSYEAPLNLRSVNVAHAKLTVIRLTDPATLARAWQDRAQTTLAPSESAYLAQSKGQSVWQDDLVFAPKENATLNQSIVLREKLPDLAPGLYLITADAGSEDTKQKDTPASKGLAPFAAAWFTKSDFSIRALRDDSGIHVFASKSGVPIAAMNKNFEQVAETQSDGDGIGFMAVSKNNADIASLIATDRAGGVAFAAITPLPQPTATTAAAPAAVATPHLEISSSREALSNDGAWGVTVKSLSATGSPQPLTGGHIVMAWERMNPADLGWKNYVFGTQAAVLDIFAPAGDFLTDLQGVAQLRLPLPKPPQEHGLYQVVVKATAEPDSGIADAEPLILPRRPEAMQIGIKPLSTNTRFAQNGNARFALIALSSDGKPRDAAGLSYQIYEEGRSFAWYQDGGRWQYKPEPTLRPIGGGSLTIKADASSTLEVPVTAGNYRLEIHDATGKALAQTDFSAGWDTKAEEVAEQIPVTLPKILQAGHEAVAHALLSEPAMVTAVIGDTRMRKTVHEFHAKGDVALPFTVGTDWQNYVSVFVTTLPPDGTLHEGSATQAITLPASKIQDIPLAAALLTPESPSAIALHKKEQTTVPMTVINQSNSSETYHYAFSASAGLVIVNGASGTFTLAAHQSRSLAPLIKGEQIGTKELRLEITGTHAPRLNRSWSLAVLATPDALHSGTTQNIAPHQTLSLPPVLAFIARQPMDGLAELVTTVVNAQPFTTAELAQSIDALRLWGDTVAATGLVPDYTVAARRQNWIAHMLRHQNADGGFSSLRADDSTMADTSAALTALAPETSEAAKAAKQAAITWLKQQLANTWFNEKDRASRAAAYAALAAADAIDPASLHYFSDTSATLLLPAVAEAQIAAAFKHQRDPNAAAFWIKKMLTENQTQNPSPALLYALSATDALPSDAVHAAMQATIAKPVSLESAAQLLHAAAADATNAGAWKLSNTHETRSQTGVLVLHAGDAALTTYRNAEDKPLFATTVSFANTLPAASVTRHIYRLNGVELSPPAQPARGEIYLVEVKGAMPSVTGDEKVVLQDFGNALRPMGCPLSTKLDTLSFMPWFTTKNLTPIETCEILPHGLNATFAPIEAEAATFSVVYFAHLDAGGVDHVLLPQVRVVR